MYNMKTAYGNILMCIMRSFMAVTGMDVYIPQGPFPCPTLPPQYYRSAVQQTENFLINQYDKEKRIFRWNTTPS